MGEKLPRWIVKRGGVYYYRRQVPTRLQSIVGSEMVRRSLETDDLGKAVIARDAINELTEAHWRTLARSADPSSRERYVGAIERARIEGFGYEPFDKILADSIEVMTARLRALHANTRRDRAGEPITESLDDQLVSAVAGLEPEPGLRFSTLVENYEKMTDDLRRDKSDLQVRKWRNPLNRAVSNIIEVLGDKEITEFSRADAVAFRDRWSARLRDEGLSADAANKDISSIGKMIALVSDRMELDLPRRLRGLRFDPGQARRPPFSTAHIRNVILAPGALAELNPTARGVVMVMIETGARPSELAHLLPSMIRLDAEIPHISIEPSKGYDMKTAFSRRQLPLVGVALEGAKLLRDGDQRYRGNTDTLSATIGKHLVERKLLETDDHSLYSFRHSFKDRLTEASAPDIVDAALMGHKFDRPNYGKGPSLALKLDWITKVAVSI